MVRIDMEKPKDCQDCRFCVKYAKGHFFCSATEDSKPIEECDRPEWCPIKKIVSCGECRFCDHNGMKKGFGWCMCKECALYDHGTRDEFFCGNGEKA